MPTLQINLPEHLARDARAAGLLEPSRVVELFAEQLRREQSNAFDNALVAMAAAPRPAPMSTAELRAELEAMRAGR